METARGRVRTRAELAAGVELGKHNFDTAESGLRLYVNWNTTSLVSYLDAAVLV